MKAIESIEQIFRDIEGWHDGDKRTLKDRGDEITANEMLDDTCVKARTETIKQLKSELKRIKRAFTFVQRCADLTPKDINLIGALNTELTLNQLSGEAKKIIG